ncbi:hypothetical protein HZS_5364, partial [Henneguya salminicola]
NLMKFIMIRLIILKLALNVEINKKKYVVEISSIPIIAKRKYTNNTLFIKNFNNKSYSCYLPEYINNKRQSELDYIASPDEIMAYYQGKCLNYSSKDYWDFSICIGINITQFHMELDQVIRGKNLFLIGLYEKDQIWNEEELVYFVDLLFQRTPSVSKKTQPFHLQKYINGTLCHFNIHRTGDVRFVCNSNRINMTIASYYEDLFCNYVFFVEYYKFCTIPALFYDDKNEISIILCRPILNEIEYKKYITSKNIMKSTSNTSIGFIISH